MNALRRFERWHAKGQFASPEIKEVADQCARHVYGLSKNKGPSLHKAKQLAGPDFAKLNALLQAHQ